MIINDSDAAKRLSSPMNLMNKLKDISSQRKSAMSLFIKPSVEEVKIPSTFNPFKEREVQTDANSRPSNDIGGVEHPPENTSLLKLEDISKDHDSKIALGLAHDSAIKLLNNSISALAAKLDDVKADKLPAVIAAASRTVESIRKERIEASKNNKDREVHYHFYTPEQKKLTDYEVIEVSQ